MTNTNPDKRGRVSVAFAALDPYIQRNIPVPREIRSGKAGRVMWGIDNRYPEFLMDLYDHAATLGAIIDGCVDFIAGDDVFFRGAPDVRANRQESYRELARGCARDLKLYGGFAVEVVRANDGSVSELYHVPVRYLRTNEENTVFWYHEKWGQSNKAPEIMPAYMPEVRETWATLTDTQRGEHAASIYWYKENNARVYPSPCWRAAIPSCEIERNIDDYHLNALENGFTSSAVLSFLNGIPDDKVKEEIERNVTEKFSGHQNAARIMINFADDKDHGIQVDELHSEDFGERYKALMTTARQKIFTAFRANPNLFGIPTENLGFSSEEYESAFKLFNRTQIRPAQRAITDAVGAIFGEPGILTIRPFSLASDTETNIS